MKNDNQFYSFESSTWANPDTIYPEVTTEQLCKICTVFKEKYENRPIAIAVSPEAMDELKKLPTESGKFAPISAMTVIKDSRLKGSEIKKIYTTEEVREIQVLNMLEAKYPPEGKEN